MTFRHVIACAGQRVCRAGVQARLGTAVTGPQAPVRAHPPALFNASALPRREEQSPRLMHQQMHWLPRPARCARPIGKRDDRAPRQKETAPWRPDRRPAARSPGATSGPSGRAGRPAIQGLWCRPTRPSIQQQCPGCLSAVPIILGVKPAKDFKMMRGKRRDHRRMRGLTRGSVERIWCPHHDR